MLNLDENTQGAERACLLQELDLRPLGAPSELFVTIHRGQTQLVWMTSPGIFMSALYGRLAKGHSAGGWRKIVGRIMKGLRLPESRPYAYLDREDPNLCAIAATDWQGRVLWRYGDDVPQGAPYCSHQGESLLCFADINGDGANEAVGMLGPGRLGVLSLDNGRPLQETRLPADNFTLVKAAHTGGGPCDWTILAGVPESGCPPHSYGNPVILLDQHLQVVGGADLPAGIGHAVKVLDADGDGLDEFLAGYTLINHDGKVAWTAEGIADYSRTMSAASMHADCTEIICDGPPGRWKAAIAGSDMFYLFDGQGKLLWRKSGVHPQFVLSGRFLPPSQDTVLFLLHCRVQMESWNLAGQKIWQGHLPGNWPMGRPSTVRDDDCFHMGRPAAVWHDPFGDRQDLVVYNEAGWPYAVNGLGRRRVEFPAPSSSRQDPVAIPPRHRPDDYGYGYHSFVADVDLDGREEVIIYDRRFAWIYGLR